MRMTILTPAFRSMPVLRACVASVRNQTAPDTGMTLRHHVRDGGSGDGTAAFLEKRAGEEAGYRLTFRSEADHGMYDALNLAFAATDGEILGHLNADEQYLPGALELVADFFTGRPDVDVLFGAVVVVDPRGRYICSRAPIIPRALHTRLSHLGTFTAAMFYRRAAVESLGTYFDTSFRAAGDADLVLRMLDAGLTMARTGRYLATFMDSGDNLALSPLAAEEQRRLAADAPPWARRATKLVEAHHRIRKLLAGAYGPAPFR